MYNESNALVSLIPFIFIIIVFSFIASVAKKGKGMISGPALVLKKFRLDSTLSGQVLIDIEGRKPGLISWVLAMFGIDPIVKLKAFKDEIVFEEASMAGEMTHVIPVRSISATITGFSRPWIYIVFGIVFIIMAFASLLMGEAGGISFIICAILGGVFFVAYSLGKKIAIFIESKGGRVIGLSFKQSVIENVPVDIEKAKMAMDIIRKISK